MRIFVSPRRTNLIQSAPCLPGPGPPPRYFQKNYRKSRRKAELGLATHPHMLRHSTGFKLANDGRDTRSIQHYLGHKNIQHTVRYTEIASVKFKEFWDD